jgi:eukaryotic-like serine/threonine-protein kinase
MVVLFFLGLGFITNHGSYETVPNVAGKNIEAAKLMLEAKGFTVEVSDSTFVLGQPKLSVIKQTPDADAIVKKGRKVYLTINKVVPNMVEVPNILGFSIKNAIIQLEDNRLVLGDTTFVPDFTKNSVVEMRYNGSVLKPLTKLYEGSRIDLVISSGPGDEIEVPDLVGLTYRDALSLAGNFQLKLGQPLIDTDVNDTANAFVYKQEPNSYFEPLPNQKIINKIRVGQIIDVWLSVKQPVKDSTGILDTLIP